ncbi:hypothetical protein [Spirilliplanes yamanashiensis]|nr:hypothetical protein [Spirilliplanes yamanashiensis]MDP9819725.1 hypothetical protein [Spirilliplanes yamanashiensis]
MGRTARIVLIVTAALVALLVLCAGVAVVMFLNRDDDRPVPRPTRAAPATTQVRERTTVTGLLRLRNPAAVARNCLATSPFLDIGSATSVKLVDENGATVGRGFLGRGTPEGTEYCVFDFEIFRVPTDAASYELQIGPDRRYPRTRAELVADDWRFEVEVV